MKTAPIEVALVERMEAQGLSAYRNQWSEGAIIDLRQAGSWEAYWTGRTSKWRNNVRRNERRLLEMGAIRHIRYRPLGTCYGDDDPRWDLYSQCEVIASRSWQGKSCTGTTITHPSIRAFLQDAHEVATRAGGVEINLLYINDVPVAFNYCYYYLGQLFGLRMGFDRSSGADGAGTVLLYRMIQDSFARGDHLFDLGAEYLDCKRPWLTSTVTSYRYSHYPPAVSRAQLIHAKRWVEGWFSHKNGSEAIPSRSTRVTASIRRPGSWFHGGDVSCVAPLGCQDQVGHRQLL